MNRENTLVETSSNSIEDLEDKISSATGEQLSEFIDEHSSADVNLAVSRLSDDEQTQLLTKLAPSAAADLIEELPESEAVGMVENLSPEQAAAIVLALPSDEQADLIQDLPPEAAEAIFSTMTDEDARRVRSLAQYDDDVAGGLMVTEFLSYDEQSTVANVVDDLRQNAEVYQDYEVQYAYVKSNTGQLRGVLRLRDLLLASPQRLVKDVMILRPMNVHVEAKLDDLRDFFVSHAYFAVPVTDREQRLVGVVRRSDVEEARGDQSERDFQRSQGLVQEELRTMPLLLRVRRRLAWLSVNILLNLVAASVIAMYQNTLTQVIALAVFLPIISDMSGCSGNQAVAVSMRELTLGLLKSNEMLRVWAKEIAVGMINGLALGLLVGIAAYLWQGNGYLGAVVGVAMMLNTIVAVTLGGSLPLLLKRWNVDPALASGPILTTITDMCGFCLILSLASYFLPRLIT